jgi:poly(A) polymerase
MPERPSHAKPLSRREDAVAAIETLRQAGHVAYFAGGCVRDLLLGLGPKDYDIATDAPPERVRSLFRNTQAVGQSFGVILARLGKSVIEIATFRTDGQYLDGRRPANVQFTTAEQDAQRRDFTINGLFLDPADNRVLDFVGGRADLASKTLRAIGNPAARFEEDHLRLLRAVRFAARFDLTVDPATAAAIRQHASELTRISPERVGDEIRRMFTPPTRTAAWRHLGDLQLLPVIFRFFQESSIWPPSAEGYHLALFQKLTSDQAITFGLALAALVLDFRVNTRNRPALASLLSTDEIRRSVQLCRKSLKISNEESEAMAGALDILPLLLEPQPTVAVMKRFLARPTSTDARHLLATIESEFPERIHWLRDQFTALQQTDCAPPPYVTGDDLTAAGLSPGPVFKRVLDAVYDAQLEGRVAAKDSAFKLAMHLANNESGAAWPTDRPMT